MRAKIVAVDSENDSSFNPSDKRSHDIQVDNFTIRVDDLLGCMYVEGEDCVKKGTGEKGGRVKFINHRLQLTLERKDIERLLDAALRDNLCSIPGSEDFLIALRRLEKACEGT